MTLWLVRTLLTLPLALCIVVTADAITTTTLSYFITIIGLSFVVEIAAIAREELRR